MNHDEEQELERYRRALAEAEPAADLGEPPPAERFWQAARGELPTDEAKGLLDRTKDDPVAAIAWQLAAEIDTEAGRRATPKRIPGWWMAAAAVLLVAVLAPLLWQQFQTVEPPTFRSGAGDGIHTLTSSAEPCPRNECRLTWEGPPGLRYRLVVLNSDGTTLIDVRDLDVAKYTLPSELLEPLEPLSVLFWRVEATSDAGLIQSETAVVTIQ